MDEKQVNNNDLVEVYSDIEIRIDKSYGQGVRFKAALEEGHDIETDTYKGITDKIDAFFAKREKEDRPKLKPIPVYKIEKHDRLGIRVLVKSALTGMHSGNGQPIVKVGNQPARTEGYSYNNFTKDLTIEEINQFNSIQARVVAADRDHHDWVSKHGIEHLKDFAEGEFEKQKAENHKK